MQCLPIAFLSSPSFLNSAILLDYCGNLFTVSISLVLYNNKCNNIARLKESWKCVFSKSSMRISFNDEQKKQRKWRYKVGQIRLNLAISDNIEQNVNTLIACAEDSRHCFDVSSGVCRQFLALSMCHHSGVCKSRKRPGNLFCRVSVDVVCCHLLNRFACNYCFDGNFTTHT